MHNNHAPHAEVLGRSPSLEARAIGTAALFSIALMFGAVSASAADKLSVVLDWFVNPDHAPLVIAKEGGYFARHGLEVDLIAPADPSSPPRLVAAGQADGAGDHPPRPEPPGSGGPPRLPFVPTGRRLPNPPRGSQAHTQE